VVEQQQQQQPTTCRSSQLGRGLREDCDTSALVSDYRYFTRILFLIIILLLVWLLSEQSCSVSAWRGEEGKDWIPMLDCKLISLGLMPLRVDISSTTQHTHTMLYGE
jgi:hypothetical protein